MRPSALLVPLVLLLTACSAVTQPASPDRAAGAASAPVAASPSAVPSPDASPSSSPPRPTPSPRLVAELAVGVEPVRVVSGQAAGELSVAVSAVLFASSPVVVVVGEGGPVSEAAGRAVELGAPVLVVPPAGAPAGGADVELARLSPRSVLAVGPGALGWAERLEDVDVVIDPADLPATSTPAPAAGTAVLLAPGEASEAAAATARAAGAQVLAVPGGDPRGSAEVVARLAELAPTQVLGVGTAFGPVDRFAARVATAVTGVQLPGGGQLVLPGKRYVALYGHPGSRSLGVLGEQGPDASVGRSVELATQYAQLDPGTAAVPTFEVIATVADAQPGADGDYSSEATIEHLRPYVDAAARVGVYVLLDLQPGYADFLSQARIYEELLLQPHVGLALDPEWRLAPGQQHLRQVGRVGADEVNAVGDYLATLVRDHALPQKIMLLHQFRTTMLHDRERIVSDRDELAVITQMDGNGTPSAKLDTWRTLLPAAPAGMSFGWKNFYDEDAPMLSPADTLAVQPAPVFVSYQ